MLALPDPCLSEPPAPTPDRAEEEMWHMGFVLLYEEEPRLCPQPTSHAGLWHLTQG